MHYMVFWIELSINQVILSLVLAYEHIVIQIKNTTDIIYLNGVVKSILETTENNFTIVYGRFHVCT